MILKRHFREKKKRVYYLFFPVDPQGNYFFSDFLGFLTFPCRPDWSAEQILGAPDTYPNYGDMQTAWAADVAGSPHEYIVASMGIGTQQFYMP